MDILRDFLLQAVFDQHLRITDKIIHDSSDTDDLTLPSSIFPESSLSLRMDSSIYDISFSEDSLPPVENVSFEIFGVEWRRRRL